MAGFGKTAEQQKLADKEKKADEAVASVSTEDGGKCSP